MLRYGSYSIRYDNRFSATLVIMGNFLYRCRILLFGYNNYPPMGTHDFFHISKILPMNKLTDLLSRSMGRLFKAYFDKKDVDTKAYEIEKIAAANAEKMKVISSALRESAHPAIGIEYNDEGIV